MGIIVQYQDQKDYVFYLKGADVIIKQFVYEMQRGFIDE